jgi:1-phosphofructokinase family hexose kinase
MILTITPNPAFDRIQTVPGFTPGHVWRAEALTLSAGGKGVNVARAVRSLGGEASCAGFLGGHSGRMEAQFVSLEGIPAQWTWIDGETRVSVIVVDPQAGETTVLNEAGPTVTPDDWARLQADALKMAGQAELVCISGSLPLGLKPSSMGDLMRGLNRLRLSVWLDSSGETLKAAIEARPAVVKVNNLEAAALLGWRVFEDVQTAVQAARTIQHSGISKVILTLGKHGAVMVSDAGAWAARPPVTEVLCTIGSGDAFLAGMVVAASRHQSDAELLRAGVAAGTANALSVGGGKFTQEEYRQVYAGTKIATLS